MFQYLPFYFCLNSQFHIIAGQLNLTCTGVNQDTFQDGHGGFGRDCFHYNINAVYNGVFLKSQLHNVDNFLSVYLGRKTPSVVEDINTFRRNRSRGCGFV